MGTKDTSQTGLYSDGIHWIYFKIETNPVVIEEFYNQIERPNSSIVLVKITEIAMKDFGPVSVSEMMKLMKLFLSLFGGRVPVVWKLSADDKRLTLNRKKIFLRTQENIAYSCGFHEMSIDSNKVTNKYYYYV